MKELEPEVCIWLQFLFNSVGETGLVVMKDIQSLKRAYPIKLLLYKAFRKYIITLLGCCFVFNSYLL